MIKKIFEQFYSLIQDLKRWEVTSLEEFFYVLFERGVWATVLYRISRALFLINIPVMKIFIRLVTFIISKFVELFLGITISAGSEIGPGLYIGHTGATVIHYAVKAGKNLNIGQCTTIGTRGAGYNQDVPEIGDNVYIGVGAKLLGAIKIGNNVKIGANAVVITDVPDNTTVVGIPAKVVKINNLNV